MDTVLYGPLVQNTRPLQMLNANLTTESDQSVTPQGPFFTYNIKTQILYILKIAAFKKKIVIRLQTNSGGALKCLFFF